MRLTADSRVIFTTILLLLVPILNVGYTSAVHRGVHAPRNKPLELGSLFPSRVSSLRTRMMEVLHLKDEKSLYKMFNVDDEDPAYVFVLPDKRNKTIVFHRHDFTLCEYPRISEVGRIEGPVFYRPLNKTTNKSTLTSWDGDRQQDWATAREEAEMNRIVEENVRTERNFIQFMENLNDNPTAADKSMQRHQRPDHQKPEPLPRSAGAPRFKNSRDHFHPDPSRRRTKQHWDGVILSPPPHPKFTRHQDNSAREEEEEDGKEELKQKPGYGNIGEVVSPPFHQDSVDESDEFLSESKPVSKLPKPKQAPRRPTLARLHLAGGNNLRTPSKKGPTASPIGPQDNDSAGWEDLGLAGWRGGLSDPVHEFDEDEKEDKKKGQAPPSNSDIFSSNRFKEAAFTNSAPASHQVRHSPNVPVFERPKPQSVIPTRGPQNPHTPVTSQDGININSVDSAEVEEEYVYMINGKPISLELAEQMQDAENHKPLNFSRPVKKSPQKWHVTSSRSAHKDADVFVGRANNPFGHSTKWQWRNASSGDGNRVGRSKRGVAELYSMVKCATGCDPLIFKGYGCYCGFLGSGTPLDGIDRCCQMHDQCYTNSGCPSYLEYFVPYLWKCYKGQPLCAVSHGEWGGVSSCASRLCQCDLKLSMCLRRYYCPKRRNVCTSSPWRVLANFITDF